MLRLKITRQKSTKVTCLTFSDCNKLNVYICKWSQVIHNIQSAQISRKQDERNIRRTTRGERGGRPPLPFFENQKSALILEKNALIVSIFRLNLPFKM